MNYARTDPPALLRVRDFLVQPMAFVVLVAWLGDLGLLLFLLLLAVQIRLNMAEKSACLQVVSAEMPRSQPCISVSPLHRVKGALRQAA